MKVHMPAVNEGGVPKIAYSLIESVFKLKDCRVRKVLDLNGLRPKDDAD